MPNTARKLNFLIEESLCRDLEALVPAGKRSRVVNDALRKELELLRRKEAIARLLASSPGQDGYSQADILDSLSRDRAAHR